MVAIFGWVSWSLGHALTNPGGGTTAERAAEWARDHDMGPLVTFGEWVSYKSPQVGGKPSFSLVGPSVKAAAGRKSGKHGKKIPVKPAPPKPGFAVPVTLSSPAGKPLPGEGAWRSLYVVNNTPAIYATFLRPDKVHTSYAAAIVSMNPHLLRFELRPGAEDPGPGDYGGAQPIIAPGTRTGLAATFNGGFKIISSGGGFYLNGVHRGGPLRKGEASMVYYRDGSFAIGTWDEHGLVMTPDVLGVRQNLLPIVVGGQVPSTVDQNVETTWGATLGGGYYVWRSGVGVTADGRIIFVYGPALDVRTLASLLARAGCVEAMELDINPDWTKFMYYEPGAHPGNPKPVSLLPDQVQPATRYYVYANRDFTAVFAR
ncbi:MAG: phosphodiester glycosidase family protein [Streptosporangiaceae bacterium]